MSYASDYTAGRQAYDEGKPWSSAKPDGWRAGWINRQCEIGPERARARRDLMRRIARKPPGAA